MNKEYISIKKIKSNQANPRTINESMFQKLKNSIKEFPEMLETRPIVVDEDFMVLGGNMRLKACQSLNIKKVWIYQVKDWSEDQKKEFIVKDNASFGEWDWDVLANEWEVEKLIDWGLTIDTLDSTAEVQEPDLEFSEYLDESNNYIVLKFHNDIDWLSAQTHFNLKSVSSKRANGKKWSKGVGRVIDGANYLKNLKKI